MLSHHLHQTGDSSTTSKCQRNCRDHTIWTILITMVRFCLIFLVYDFSYSSIPHSLVKIVLNNLWGKKNNSPSWWQQSPGQGTLVTKLWAWWATCPPGFAPRCCVNIEPWIHLASIMMKHFLGHRVFQNFWNHLFDVFWQWYLNHYSKHVLSEDNWQETSVAERDSWPRPTRPPRMSCWAQRPFSDIVAQLDHILEDSIEDP